jgi:hypothetical protein
MPVQGVMTPWMPTDWRPFFVKIFSKSLRLFALAMDSTKPQADLPVKQLHSYTV